MLRQSQILIDLSTLPDARTQGLYLFQSSDRISVMCAGIIIAGWVTFSGIAELEVSGVDDACRRSNNFIVPSVEQVARMEGV
jgi:hypothetical protein